MLWNNIKITLRNLRKNKVFAAINIAGLAVGMTIYVFGGWGGEVSYHTTVESYDIDAGRWSTETSGATVVYGLDDGRRPM